MKLPIRPIYLLWLATFLLGSCASPKPTPENTPTPTPGLPTPVVYVTSAPDPRSAIDLFMKAWLANDYAAMYALLTPDAQQKITQDDFVKRYRDAMTAMAFKEIQYAVLSTNMDTKSAQANLRYTYVSNVVNPFQRDVVMGMRLVDGGWKIDWEEGLILPELRGGNSLTMDYQLTKRGDIFDRNGEPFTKETTVVSVGINPALVNEEEFGSLVKLISMATGVSQGFVRSKYEAFAGQDWYVSIGEAPKEEAGSLIPALYAQSGTIMNEYTSRYYTSTAGAQTIGYVGGVQKEELDEYLRRGYARNSLVGRSGLEDWGEKILAGKVGGTLYVVDSKGSILSSLGRTDPQPSGSVTLTIDRDFQDQVEQAMGGMRGSAIVMERDTGRILAMVSSPGFDSNLFNPNNTNSGYGLGDVVSNPDNPLYNRATQGEYPLGSVFKIITMAAGIESGTFAPDNKYQCGYDFNELPGRVLHDWTWDHCQTELQTEGACTTRPSGELTLIEGLMRSCNPWFYHIGYDLNRQGRKNAIADMARAFGLGAPTGLREIPEKSGNIINPGDDAVEAVNQSIGQGQTTVTPLQVVRFLAAIGNGGTLYRPGLVEKTTSAAGVDTQVFKPESMGTLPIKPATLDAIRDGLRRVIANPRGTASHRFRNMKTVMFGKTGTAETGIPGSPHSWFAGYTDLDDKSELANIAIVVLVEDRGEGSEYAAPIFRRIIEIYVAGKPQALYWWETNFGVTRTPTPFGFDGTATAEAALEEDR